MPQTNYWRTDRPDEGFSPANVKADPVLPVRTFLPDSYEPGYPYPLLVLFHGRGGNEDQVMRVAPRVSCQNFIYLSIRGPEALAARPDGRPAAGWQYPNATAMLGQYVRLAVEMTRTDYHVHSERIYLAGVGEGAQAAFRAALALGDKVAGVIALNGGLPTPVPGEPAFRMRALRDMRVLLANGTDDEGYTTAAAARDVRALHAAGANVRHDEYPTAGKLHPDMLRDVNRWVIANVEAEYEMYLSR